MASWLKVAVGALIRGGAPLVVILLLDRTVWSGADLGGVPYFSVLAAAGGAGSAVGRGGVPTGRWLLIEVVFSIGLAATLVAGLVLIETLFSEPLLSSTPQRATFAAAIALSTFFWLGLPRVLRPPAFADPDGPSRRAAIRDNIRREIEEIEKSAGKQTRSDDHG